MALYVAPRGRRRPHVVLIQVDQWRSDALGVAGHPVVSTPILDEMASSGARFTRAYTPSPTCVPSRMSLLTGLAPAHTRRVGYIDGVTFDVPTTMAGSFRSAGYQTHAVGKMHVAPDRNRAGFDDVVLHNGYCHDSRMRERAVEFTDDYVPWLRERSGSTRADVIDRGDDPNSVVARPWDLDESVHPSTFVVSSAIDWLYRRDPDQPFFLYVSFAGPHAPYTPPAWAFDRYLTSPANREYTPKGSNWADVWEPLRDDHAPDAFVADYDEETALRARAGYFGNMSHIDAQIGRLYCALREFGLAYDTYIAFTSDHGELLGDHGMWRKGFPYEGSAGVPLFVLGPGIAPGQVIEDLVSTEDVMPTLLELADAQVPDDLDGRSCAPTLLGDGDARARRHLHGEHHIHGTSLQWITTERWKYVWRSVDGMEQLFDLGSVQGEECDLLRADSGAADEIVDVAARLRAILVAELTGRPEGFVHDGALIAGQPCGPLLAEPFRPDTGTSATRAGAVPLR